MGVKPATSHIRSYVLRQGRMTAGQVRAFEDHWPRYGIEYEEQQLDLDRVFDRVAPRVLDIGIGTGDTSLEIAKMFPENDYLAVEVHRPGIGSLLRRLNEESVSNVRVICHDVIEVLKNQLADHSFDQVFIFFPDPWPKKKHHKRRLIQAGFLDLLVSRMSRNGRLYIATDWADLAEHVLEVCEPHPGLFNLAGPGHVSPRPCWRPHTRFEQRGERLEHEVLDFIYAVSDAGEKPA